MVPRGIDLPGFFRSPDSPTPAVIPVNAGKMIANTGKNWFRSPFSADKMEKEVEALYPVLPRKNNNRDTSKIATTK